MALDEFKSDLANGKEPKPPKPKEEKKMKFIPRGPPPPKDESLIDKSLIQIFSMRRMVPPGSISYFFTVGEVA